MPKYALPHDVERVVKALWLDLDSAVSRSCLKHYEEGAYGELVKIKVHPRNYDSPTSYWRDAVAVGILKKNKDLQTGIDTKKVATDNFWESEHQCYRTNQRLLPFLHNTWKDEDGRVLEIILRIRKKVESILGHCPDLLDGRFGPGATYIDKGQLTTVPDKMSSQPTLTNDAWPFLFPWSGTMWAKACAEASKSPSFIRGNRFTTVPKDGTKDRGIAIEPSVNVFFQLAYGQVMKERMAAAGINLLTAQLIHRQVACEASIRGHFATIDLSNASDTVAWALVKLLLPHRWFDVLSTLRSRYTLIEGKWVLLEKFSSMGNGFTFELESVIFLAISMVAMEESGIHPLPGENVHVFGDDIIVPTGSGKNVLALLRYLGFTPNEDKTFLSGPFRESCGGDFFSGVEVRPYNLKRNPSEPQDYIGMANGIRRLADPDGPTDYRSIFTQRAWFRVLDALPSNIRRLRGPKDLGDIVIHDDRERWTTRTRNCIRYIRVYRTHRVKTLAWDNWKPDIVLATALYGVGDGLRGITPRKPSMTSKEGWVPRS